MTRQTPTATVSFSGQAHDLFFQLQGKFGQGKRRFGIGRLMTKLASTGETAIALCFLVMNLEKWLAAILLCLFFKERKPLLQYFRNLM